MKQGEIIRAYKSLKKLSDQNLPIATACKIHRLIVKIRPVFEFQVEEENKMLNQLNPEVKGNGNIEFESVEDAQLFKSRMNELSDLEVEDIEITPVSIVAPADAVLTPNDIEALEGFIEFTDC